MIKYIVSLLVREFLPYASDDTDRFRTGSSAGGRSRGKDRSCSSTIKEESIQEGKKKSSDVNLDDYSEYM